MTRVLQVTGCARLLSCASELLTALAGCGNGSDGGSGAAGTFGGTGAAGLSGAAGAAGTMAIGGATGAGGMTDAAGAAGGATGAPTFQAVFSEILSNSAAGNCMFGGCHGGPPDSAANGNLRMVRTDPAGTYAALVNVATTSTACMGMIRVTPGNAGASLLSLKLRSNPPCGVQMPIPPLGAPLSEAQIVQVETWINNGAMDD